MENTTTAATEVVEQNDEQAKAIIEALDPAVLAQIVATKGFVLKPETDYKKELAKADSEATKRNYSTIEQGIFEMTGVSKKDGEKVHEYQRRAFTEIQDKTKKEKEEVTTEVTEVTSTYEKMIQSMQKEMAEMKKREKDREEQSFKDKASGLIEGAFGTIKLNADESEMEIARKEKRTLFQAWYEPTKTPNNGIIWKDKDSEELMIENGQPMTPEAIIKKFHGSWLAKEGNAATGLGAKLKSDKPELELGGDRETITAKIADIAKQKGIPVTHKDMIDLKKKAYAAAGIPW